MANTITVGRPMHRNDILKFLQRRFKQKFRFGLDVCTVRHAGVMCPNCRNRPMELSYDDTTPLCMFCRGTRRITVVGKGRPHFHAQPI